MTDVSTGDGALSAREHRAPLQIARVRTRDLLAVGARVGLRPRAPGFVRVRGVARTRQELHLPGPRRRAPADHAPAGHRAGVAHVGLVAALGRRVRREREELPRVARRADDAAGGLAKKRRDLPRCRAREQRGARGIAADAEDLALGTGADEQAAARLDQQVVRRVLAGLPVGVPQPVRADAVDRAAIASPRRAGDHRRRRLGSARIDDGDRRDLGRDRRHGRAAGVGAGGWSERSSTTDVEPLTAAA